MEKIDRKKVFGKYGGHCAYCGRQIEENLYIPCGIGVRNDRD